MAHAERTALANLLFDTTRIFDKIGELERRLGNVCETNRKLLLIQTELSEMQEQCKSLKEELGKIYKDIDNKLDEGNADG